LQTYLVEALHKIWKKYCRRGRDKRKARHQLIVAELQTQSEWPPIATTDLSSADLLKMETVVAEETAGTIADDSVSEDGSELVTYGRDESKQKEDEIKTARDRRNASGSQISRPLREVSICLLTEEAKTCK
jgi:hypothetical protein